MAMAMAAEANCCRCCSS